MGQQPREKAHKQNKEAKQPQPALVSVDAECSAATKIRSYILKKSKNHLPPVAFQYLQDMYKGANQSDTNTHSNRNQLFLRWSSLQHGEKRTLNHYLHP